MDSSNAMRFLAGKVSHGVQNFTIGLLSSDQIFGIILAMINTERLDWNSSILGLWNNTITRTVNEGPVTYDYFCMPSTLYWMLDVISTAVLQLQIGYKWWTNSNHLYCTIFFIVEKRKYILVRKTAQGHLVASHALQCKAVVEESLS